MKHDNVDGFPGYYVSKRGNVYSRINFEYLGHCRGKRRVYTASWHKIKPYLKKTGKYQVSLYKPNNPKVYTVQIHKLVAKIYVPNPHNLPCVCHLDDIGTHNHYKNLVWGTVKDNVRMMIENHKSSGTKLWTKPIGFNKGPKNPAYGTVKYGTIGKLNKSELIRLLRDHTAGIPISELSKEYGVSIRVVKRKVKLKEDILKKFGLL